MRTSKISKETARIAAALSSSRRRTRSVVQSLRQVESSVITGTTQTTRTKRELDEPEAPSETSNAEDTETSSRKRKRGGPDPAVSPTTRRKPARRVKLEDGNFRTDPPTGWEEMYNVTKGMRKSLIAPVDIQGCEMLFDPKATPRDKRFQTLIALMLSSQTKDQVTAAAMGRLKSEISGGLTLENILAIDPVFLDDMIGKVGFHNTKTKHIKMTAEILRDKWDSEIPDSAEKLMTLPGVGPKMAHLTMSAAWDKTEGIGVDVHVHRITNLWGWHKTKTPEETRKTLEAWLPQDEWHKINTLLVGFGQMLCKPVGRKCGECVLAERGLCPGSLVRRKVKREVKTEVKVEDAVKIKEEIKIEETELAADDGRLADIEDFGG